MVCKNCGADLKPNTKYCLECGSYIDDDGYDEEYDNKGGVLSTDHKPVSLRPASKKKKKKFRLTVVDYAIYGILLTIMIVSIIVIIVTLSSQNSASEEPVVDPTPIIEESTSVEVANYEAVVPAGLNSTVQGDYLYVSDNMNYSFSFQSLKEEFDAYLDDPSLLEENLEGSEYDFVSSSTKSVNSRVFLVYVIKVSGVEKYLYLTKVTSTYTGSGVIEVLPGGDWEEALFTIDSIVNSIRYTSTRS